MTVDKLLARLDKVKATRPGCWIACCPAHDDRSPSLTIKETDDGRVLVKCWAGCAAPDVVQSAGLSLRDLFPESPKFQKSLRAGERWIPRDVLEALAYELFFSCACCSAMAAGESLTEGDAKRLFLAANRIYAAWREVTT